MKDTTTLQGAGDDNRRRGIIRKGLDLFFGPVVVPSFINFFLIKVEGFFTPKTKDFFGMWVAQQETTLGRGGAPFRRRARELWIRPAVSSYCNGGLGRRARRKQFLLVFFLLVVGHVVGGGSSDLRLARMQPQGMGRATHGHRAQLLRPHSRGGVARACVRPARYVPDVQIGGLRRASIYGSRYRTRP